MTVTIKEEALDHVTLTNDLSADIEQYEFCVIAGYAAVADEDVDDGETGSFLIEESKLITADDLVAGENTFGTEGQEVFWSTADSAFSDTETAGYYLVGYLITTKDSNGVIGFEKLRHAVLITT